MQNPKAPVIPFQVKGGAVVQPGRALARTAPRAASGAVTRGRATDKGPATGVAWRVCGALRGAGDGCGSLWCARCWGGLRCPSSRGAQDWSEKNQPSCEQGLNHVASRGRC